ncbi:MAG TPA: carboxypeptidase regulatory-like domain-containing protein, partial [Terracidiphilus sp.]|nr:carboxypeptidase regulatory-like domain-containing protein [Terracidiphilus sp.]
AQAAPAQPGPAHAELNCPIDGERWSCLTPAGFYDVRLEAEGYAPVYDWAVSLKPAESADLGPTQLQGGLSVFGRAVQKDGTDPPGPCLATLEADAQRRGGLEPQPDNAPADEKTFTVPVDPHGYFQIVGPMPGLHVLDVECLAASGFRELQVQSDGETRVDPPLVLEELTLDITVTPRTDPAGRPWRLTVDATSPRLRRIADSATTSADGHWIRHGLMAGSYRVVVSSSDGMQWLKKDFDLRFGSGSLALRLASVSVAGQVLLNGQAVRARLLFSNQAGGDPVTLLSDDQGRFKGLLPVAPDAQETMWSIEAHVAHPSTVRRLESIAVPKVAAGASAWLDLELPTVPVRGTVLSADGQPQDGAQVTFEAAGSGFRTTTSTDREGSFEMDDLPPGKYNAVAHSDYGISEPTPFAVTGSSESQLKLILRPYLHIPFYVVSNEKEPLSDATVQVWLAPGVPRALGRTDQNGRFEVSLPPGTTEVGLTVGAPDYAIKLTKMPVSSTPAAGASDPSQDQGQDQNTVTLGTNGGTLVLNFEPSEGTLDRSATLYLAHDGAIVDARTLAGWGTSQAGASGDGPAEVDGIEPGDYALCVVRDPSQLAKLWQGMVPQASCSAGTVKAGQTLTLTPRTSTTTAP